ncbi:hypothetical protein AAEX28_04005 [Lentisphaerota bacterium WC36G]|nr:hypothetical protein LJT99_06880 [Lentisphaerae bacterium WC36]
MANSQPKNWKDRNYTPMFVKIGSLHAMFDGADKDFLRELAEWGKAILPNKDKAKSADRFNVAKMQEICNFICTFPDSFMDDKYKTYEEARFDILGEEVVV